MQEYKLKIDRIVDRLPEEKVEELLDYATYLSTKYSNQTESNERESWLNLSTQSLNNAYGDDEPEYSLDLIKEVNPYYEGR